MEKITNLLGVFILFSILTLSSVPIASAQGYTVTELWNNPMQVNDVAVSGDGNYLVAVNNTGVYFFSRDSSQPRWWCLPRFGYFESVAISANGEYVAAGYTNTSSESGSLWYFNESTTTFDIRGYTWKSSDIPGAINNPRLVAISDNGAFVVVGANNETGKYTFLKYFNDSTVRFGSSEAETWNLWTMEALASSLDMSADGNYVAEGGTDPPTIGWVSFFKDSSTGPQGWLNDNLLPITDVALSDDGYAVAAVSPFTPDTLYYWKDAKNLPSDSPANWTNLLGYGCVDMSSDGDKVVAGTPMIFVCGVHMWDGARMRTGSNETESWNRFAGQMIPDIGISRDGMIIAATAVIEGACWTYFLTSSGGLIGQFAIDAPGMAVSTSISGNTTAVATYSVLGTVYVYGISQGPVPVGGEILSLDGLMLLAPYLAVVLVAGAVAGVLLRRRMP